MHKAGYRTTEFWLSVISIVITASGALPTPAHYKPIIAAVIAGLYALSRGIAKIKTGPRPFYVTTEFWLSVVTALIVVLSAIPTPDHYKPILLTVITVLYGISRGLAKLKTGASPVEIAQAVFQKTGAEAELPGGVYPEQRWPMAEPESTLQPDPPPPAPPTPLTPPLPPTPAQ